MVKRLNPDIQCTIKVTAAELITQSNQGHVGILNMIKKKRIGHLKSKYLQLLGLLLQMIISQADSEPCGREFRDKKHIQSGQPWKQLSLPRLVLLNRWRFNFELLHWCKKKKKKGLESQAVFLTSLTEAAHQMKGMCEIAFPSISVSMLRTQTLRHRHDAEAGPCCSIRC